METIIELLINTPLPFYVIMLIAIGATLIENILPPAPGDFMVIFLGSLIGLGKADFLSLIIATTIGSTIGFILMYLLGKYFGHKVIDSNRFKFINEKTLHKPRYWFHKYGYFIIVINRFLTGTRAVISFLAGISEMNLTLTAVLAGLSSLLWNGLLIYLGMVAGTNWRAVDNYVSIYGCYIILPIFAMIALYFAYKWVKNKRKSKTN